MTKSKEEYESLLNQVLGTNVKWSKLSIKELDEIANALATKLEKKGLNADIVDLIIPQEYQGPIIKQLKKILSNVNQLKT
ncbi:MAG: hypothetical protein QXM17_08785 [Metallosphaera sp.]